MRAYRQTFRRHRRLLTAPVVAAAAIAGWFTFGAAPAYRSSAAVWVDNGSSVSSAMAGTMMSGPGPAGPVGPAGFESQVVAEMLRTPGFDLAVGRGSLLPRFLESGGTAGGFGPAVLLTGPPGDASPSAAQAAAAASVSTGVSVSSTGPQVMLLSYSGPSPAVARSVLRSLIGQLGDAASAFGDSIGKSAAAFYERNLSTATWAVANTQRALASYVGGHSHSDPVNDPTYRGLVADVGHANARLASARAASSEAEVEAHAVGQGATMEMIDPPTLPGGPVTGVSSQLTGVLAGAFAGAVLSLLVLIALTPRPPVRWDAELALIERLAAPPRSRSGPRPQRNGA